MPNTQKRQGKHLLSTTPTTKQVTCWSLRTGTDMRGSTTHRTKDDQWGPPKEKGTTWADSLNEVLQRRMLATQRRKNEESLLPQETNTREKKVRGWGKDARTRPWGEGSEKTQSDIEAYQRHIQELLEELEWNRKTIADLETNVENQRRTIASSGFMMGRCNGVLTLDVSPRHTTTGRS